MDGFSGYNQINMQADEEKYNYSERYSEYTVRQ